MKISSLNSSYAAKTILGIAGLVLLINLIDKIWVDLNDVQIYSLASCAVGTLIGCFNNLFRLAGRTSIDIYYRNELRTHAFFIPACWILASPFSFILAFGLLSIIIFESRNVQGSKIQQRLNWELIGIYSVFILVCSVSSLYNDDPIHLGTVMSIYILSTGAIVMFFLLRHLVFLNSQMTSLTVANKALDQEKSWYSDLFSLVSHNIRTPLTTMYATLEVEKIKNTDLASSPGYEKLEQELNKVLSIVDQSFRQNAWLKQEEQKLAHIKQLLCKQYPEVEFLTGIKREYFNMTVTSAEATALFLGLDSTISNAIKYGGEQVLVTSAEFDGASDKINIVLKVSDDGIGMNNEVLKQYGTPFHSSRKSSEGSGLGVYFTHSLMKQLGWEIVAESEEGVGTEISFKINFDRDRLNS